MKTNKTITIIGGMGPQASLRLHSLILDEIAAKNDFAKGDDFPLIRHLSFPVDDFISDKTKIDKAVNNISQELKKLKLGKNDITIVACNTAHVFLDRITDLKDTQNIHLQKLVNETIRERNITKTGLLCSPSSKRSRLFEKHISASELVHLNDKHLSAVEASIRRVYRWRQYIA